MNDLMMFDFEENPVRAFMRDGQEWFVAVDVCRCIGIENNRDAIARLHEDEKSIIDLNTVGYADGIRPGNPNTSIVNEPGLYRLIFASRKPEAERLKRFVFHEVLPALRKTGTFTVEPVQAIEDVRHDLAMVREMRLTHGRHAAQALWQQLGLPMPEEKPLSLSRDVPEHHKELYAHISEFIDECCEQDSTSKVTSSELFKAYNRWAAAVVTAPYANQSGFGYAMRLSPYKRMRKGNVFYFGLRLREKGARLA